MSYCALHFLRVVVYTAMLYVLDTPSAAIAQYYMHDARGRAAPAPEGRVHISAEGVL